MAIFLALGPVLLGACRETPRAPVIVFGVDGAEWKVIEWLWDQDRAPNLRALAENGVSGPLHTFHYASPVIWTTVATGVYPAEHGITEFVVPTAKGDLPVSSTLRKTPALWNILSAAGRTVAVAGWWATWPAEEVNGVVVSDRATHDLDDRVFPSSYLPQLEELIERARNHANSNGSDTMILDDRVFVEAGLEFARQPYDLTMVYVRGPDISSHFNWRYFEPEGFPETGPEEIHRGRERIAREYEYVDWAVGALLDASGGRANLIVMSDHGFKSMDAEELRIQLDFDVVLAHFGFLERDANGVVMERSLLYTHATPVRSLDKKVRFAMKDREAGGTVEPSERHEIRRRLESALSTVTYGGGDPAFRVRHARDTGDDGADFVVEVLPDGAVVPLKVGKKSIRGALKQVSRISGTHNEKNFGVFFAVGPDIEVGATMEDLRVIDIPPTILYAVGLPTAENFVGTVRRDIFTGRFRRKNPVRTVPSWGGSREGSATASEVDAELVEQLRALGYVD
jgi:predicted AlkP superfamily phosphohydrolase/phosphomutase